MRILMLDNEFPPLGGGMGTANQAVLRYFSERPDLEVDLITSALGGRFEKEQFSEHIRIFKVPVWNRNIHHSSNRELVLYTLQAFFKAWQLHRSQAYDFCFAWSAVPAGAVALALYRLQKLPYMVWISGPDTPGFEERYRNIYPIITPLLKRIWRAASPLIAKCSEEVDLIHAVEDNLPIKIIPNGVDINKFRPGKSAPVDEPLKVVCSARLIERKGQRYLIQAVKQLLDAGVEISVDFLGDGDSLSDYQQLCIELGVEDQIRFIGYVPREEIADYYATANVFVLPSFFEGMSLAALEAMASGLPLILTRTGGTDELVQEGVNGFTFEWGDVDALAFHLSQLAEDRELAEKMGDCSRDLAQQFSWDFISNQFLELCINKELR